MKFEFTVCAASPARSIVVETARAIEIVPVAASGARIICRAYDMRGNLLGVGAGGTREQAQAAAEAATRAGEEE